ncbi:MAG: type II secretion system F family protein [Verrucomicrobia bacterium]|nr:type II secretion system F family protein [Verrucomicrobiota bacterium]
MANRTPDAEGLALAGLFFPGVATTLVWLASSGLAVGLLLLALGYAFYFLQTLPWRRRERAALLMDIMESGLSGGQALEQSLIAASATRDRMLPVRAHLLAAHLESGLPMAEALRQTPWLLPPAVQRLFELGTRHGILPRLLPACRTALDEPPQPRWVAAQQVALSLLLTALQCAGVLGLLRVVVLPKFLQIQADLTGDQFLTMETWVIAADRISMANLVVCGVLAFWLFARIGGPRFLGLAWLRESYAVDALLRRVPWRRDRMRRDFAAALASLLDAGVPEAEALREAGGVPGSPWYQEGAARAAQCLSRGVALPEAIREVDDAGELRWRLTNARHGRTGFRAAIQGWLDGLDARAHAQEFTAAQGLFCAGLLIQAVAVGLAAAGFFGSLVQIIEGGVQW